MIVVGVDPHKQTHTAVAVAKATGELVEELTVDGPHPGHQELLELGPTVGRGAALRTRGLPPRLRGRWSAS